MENCEYTEVTNDTERNITNKKKSVQWKPLLRQLLVCSGGFTAMFVSGLCVGAPTVFIPQLRKEANGTNIITDEMATWLSSAIFFGGIPFVIIVSIITNLIGKKITFLISSVDLLVAYIVLYYSSNVTHILISQVIQSFYNAAQLVIIPLVFAEYTSPRYRGTLMLINSATAYWGIWASNTIGTFLYWKVIPLFGMVCVSYIILTLFVWPESPYWLASKGKFQECVTAHRWLKGSDEESERELETLINSYKEYNVNCATHTYFTKKDKIINLWLIIKSKEFYKPTLLALAIINVSHLSGKGLCTVYALDIIKQITNSESAAYIWMLILDGVTVFSMYAGTILTRVLRRRTMLLVSSSICATILFILSLYLYLIKLSIIIENIYVSTVLLSVFSISAGCGPMVMGFPFFGEVVPIKSRNLSFCLTCILNKIIIAVVLKTGPLLFRALGIHGVFLLFGSFLLVIVLILYKYLPETKDKTIQEIAESMIGTKPKNNEKSGELLVNKCC